MLLQWMELVTDQYQESVVKSLLGATHAFLQVRAYMQEMGKAAGIPVIFYFAVSILDLYPSCKRILQQTS